MTSRFLTDPAVKWVGGKYPWMLLGELAYVSDKYGYISVPAGYCTDFASVPRIPGTYWLVGGRAVLPAILHDHAYDCRTAVMKRSQADALFLEAMAVANDPSNSFTRWLMYTAVRAGGWKAWRTDSTHKCPRRGA